MLSTTRKGTHCLTVGYIFILFNSVLFLQNWFVYDTLPTNLAAEKNLIDFQNNLLPPAENYNSYCQVRFLCASLLDIISEVYL